MSSKSAHRPIALMLLLTVMTLFFLAQLIIGDLATSLTLIPQKVIQGNEWWRIVTHMIAVDSYWIAFLGIPMYFWLGREVAQLTHDSVFLLGLLIGGVIIGLIYTLMPIECPPMGAGLFGMLYSASIAMTIVRSPAIIISALTKLRISIIATCIIGFGFVFLGASMFSGNMMQMYTYSLESGSGIMIGLLSGLIWSHFRLASREEDRSKTTESGFPIYVPIASQPIRRDEKAMINIIIDQRDDIHSSIMDEDMDEEEALNVILEKIHDNHIECLSDEEKAFLERYSRSLK
ncbi:MAG: hypothetical protein FJ212_04655 [Ignavibacteria bacterium]|nr:hypothetical protein [Ignavibacteria bacterium]